MLQCLDSLIGDSILCLQKIDTGQDVSSLPIQGHKRNTILLARFSFFKGIIFLKKSNLIKSHGLT